MNGHPSPVVTWSKSFGQLPQGRVESNSSFLTLHDVQKSDSGDYVCTASNMLGKVVQRTLLVVVTLPQFTVKPPVKIVRYIGANITLNCSATGDPQPVISWKRQGSQLPVGRSQQIDGALVVRDVQKEDAGNYICIATSAGVFDVERVTYVELQEPKGKLSYQQFYCEVKVSLVVGEMQSKFYDFYPPSDKGDNPFQKTISSSFPPGSSKARQRYSLDDSMGLVSVYSVNNNNNNNNNHFIYVSSAFSRAQRLY